MFNIPSTTIIGGGASNEAGAQSKKMNAKKVLPVIDSFMVSTGLAGKIALGSPGSNPIVSTAEEVVELYHQAW